MGICWSDPPPPPVLTSRAPVYPTNQPCKGCGTWAKEANIDYCQVCLQKNAMNYIAPSAPPYQVPQYPNPQYTYAVQYPQPQMYNYYQARPPYPPQQRQMGTGTAMATGFVVGAVLNEMLDPTE